MSCIRVPDPPSVLRVRARRSRRGSPHRETGPQRVHVAVMVTMTWRGFRAEVLPAAVTGAAGAATLTVILVFRNRLPIPRAEARLVGFIVLYSGIGLVIWAAVHLKGAIRGLVSPRLEGLVVTGPYGLVRHPVYLGTTVAMIGAAVVARSSWGLLGAVVVFLPAEAHRARLEDRALAERFGDAWREYAARVGFFLPRLGRRWTRAG